jgi:hypothetical protein
MNWCRHLIAFFVQYIYNRFIDFLCFNSYFHVIYYVICVLVVACRVSPLQKAALVRMIKLGENQPITLGNISIIHDFLLFAYHNITIWFPLPHRSFSLICSDWRRSQRCRHDPWGSSRSGHQRERGKTRGKLFWFRYWYMSSLCVYMCIYVCKWWHWLWSFETRQYSQRYLTPKTSEITNFWLTVF